MELRHTDKAAHEVVHIVRMAGLIPPAMHQDGQDFLAEKEAQLILEYLGQAHIYLLTAIKRLGIKDPCGARQD